MSKFTCIPYQPYHFKLLKPGSRFSTAAITSSEYAQFRHQMEGATLLYKGEIVAIMGVSRLWNGVAEATIVPSELFYRHLKSGVKEVRNLIEVAFGAFGLHRLQATTLSSAKHHGRFVEFLGFHHEGRLRGYGPDGEDLDIWSILKDDNSRNRCRS